MKKHDYAGCEKQEYSDKYHPEGDSCQRLGGEEGAEQAKQHQGEHPGNPVDKGCSRGHGDTYSFMFAKVVGPEKVSAH